MLRAREATLATSRRPSARACGWCAETVTPGGVSGRHRRLGLRRLAAGALRAPRPGDEAGHPLLLGRGWATPGVPAWVDYDRAVYGLGDLDGGASRSRPTRRAPPSIPSAASGTLPPKPSRVPAPTWPSGFQRFALRRSRLHRLPVRPDAGHELHHRPPRRRNGSSAAARPRVQARARPRRVRRPRGHRPGGARSQQFGLGPRRARTEPPNRRIYLTVNVPFIPIDRCGVQ